MELTKPRIVALAMATAAAGFWLASPTADAVLLSSAFFGVALAAARRVTPVNAGRLFRASLLYLPALLILMTVDRGL